MNINNCTFSGRLTADAELKFNDNKLCICTFRVAVNSRRQNEETIYLNVVLFGKQGEAINEYLKKGTLVGTTGRLRAETYESEGVKKTSYSLVADNVELGPKGE